jgi:hypothetical protein
MLQKNCVEASSYQDHGRKSMLDQNNSSFCEKIEIVLHAQVSSTNFKEVSQQYLNTLNIHIRSTKNGDTVIANYDIPSHWNKE